MVLEGIFPKEWVNNKPVYAFFLGWIYTLIGIVVAKLVFPADPSLVAVGITSILLIPTLQRLYEIETKEIYGSRHFSWRSLYKFNRNGMGVYLGLFLGMFIVYLTAATILPQFQVNQLFKVQLNLRGAAETLDFSPNLFFDILGNNWWVLIATFLISLLIADGGIFMIAWNASVWGTIFGVTARSAALATTVNPFIYVAIIIAVVAPHMMLEMLSYIMAAISGGSLSKGIMDRNAKGSKRKINQSHIYLITIYSIILFFIAMNIMLLGAFVETTVLVNADIYRDIIVKSLQAGF
ncbi:MAG: stage II sporulation protein M [Candidatus Aenigmarchaeota archaeon]|nr:stage II sporulation protein M [Candidatus Aenigmarchaeota archaeon]